MSLRNFDFVVKYCTALNKQVPDALLRCESDNREDVDVQDRIPTFESHFLFLARSRTAKLDRKKVKILHKNRSTSMTFGTL